MVGVGFHQFSGEAKRKQHTIRILSQAIQNNNTNQRVTQDMEDRTLAEADGLRQGQITKAMDETPG